MSTFTEMLPLELKDIHNYIEPEMELEKSDHEVGIMSDELKKLFTMWRQLGLKCAEAKLHMSFNVKGINIARCRELDSKAEAIKNIFWIAIYDEFELWDKSDIGVRKGFNVVWSDEDKSQHMPPFLRQIFNI